MLKQNKMENKKVLIVIGVDNHIDLITNSSSELFVLNGETLGAVENMVEAVYPDYLTEYEPLICLRDANPNIIDSYLSWVEDGWYSSYGCRGMSEEEKQDKETRWYINRAEKYGMTPQEFYANWDERGTRDYWYGRESEEGLLKAAKQLDPDGKIFLLFSIDENPNWEMQESLMSIGQRIHMG